MQSTDTRPMGERQVENAITQVSASTIRPGMHVWSFGGEPLGRVTAVDNDELVVKRPWLSDVRVPLQRVLTVGQDSLILTQLREPQSLPSPARTPAGRVSSLLTRKHT
jgi:hypothetical protein